MEKTKHFHNTKFPPEAIQQAFDKISPYLPKDKKEEMNKYRQLEIHFEVEQWQHDTESEFFADYIKNVKFAKYCKMTASPRSYYELYISFEPPCSNVSVAAPERSIIESIYQIFDNWAPKCILPVDKRPRKDEPVVFIGHGKSEQWRDLKDHLHDKHGYKIEAYEVGTRSGHAIRDILEDMMAKSSVAILVMTGEDKDENGNLHARENVIHELGLFQGKLGFTHAIIILEEGTSEFSNIHGINQIRYSKNNIKETFGDVVATLKREF